MHSPTWTHRLKSFGFVLLLPLVATAVVYADGLRHYALVAALPNSESLIARSAKHWQEGEDGLDQTFRHHYIRLNDRGRLAGTISAIEDLTGETIGLGSLEVTVVRRSRVLSRSMTDSDGNFVTQPLRPGPYTLCVAGDEGFLAYAILAVSPRVIPEETLPVPQGNGDVSNRLKIEVSPAAFASALQQDESVRITAAVIPPEFTALKQILANYVNIGLAVGSGAAGGSQINVKDSVVAGGFQIALQEDGRLIGRIAPLTSEEGPIRLQEMNAFLLLDDEIYARVSVDEDGNFVFHDVEPNVYGFVAAGQDGLAALSFQAVEQPQAENLQSSEPNETFVPASNQTIANDASDVLAVAICPPEDLPYLADKINRLGEEPVRGDMAGMPPMAPGALGGMPGFGGPGTSGFGTTGGGPGGFGGFDFVGLVETGIGIWVLTELFDEIDDDESSFTTPPAASPFTLQPSSVGATSTATSGNNR